MNKVGFTCSVSVSDSLRSNNDSIDAFASSSSRDTCSNRFCVLYTPHYNITPQGNPTPKNRTTHFQLLSQRFMINQLFGHLRDGPARMCTSAINQDTQYTPVKLCVHTVAALGSFSCGACLFDQKPHAEHAQRLGTRITTRPATSWSL